ncbi:sushi domain-containing protein 4 isoform X3 [Rhineura floridana]|uniref:sushi domain-containing protein 4 isoform X3 n=1 Tax=Rhineura floridana TaxID=261503 RepID=UPI002AC7FAC8|nr:sushi domain-containing protein 4 isoform X3 [Rhineura floridana]
MYHGMNPNSGDLFLEKRRQQQQQQQPPLLQRSQSRLSLVVLWFQLALCFGPAQITGGFDELHACADPGFPEYGYKMPGAGVFFESSVVRFHCQEGYRLKGPSKKLCERHFNGSLSWKPSDKPVCLQEATDCLAPVVEDAEVHNKTYRTGDKLIISCHEGFQIRYPDLDNMVSVCQDDGTWDNLPICQGCLRPLVLPHSYINISEFESSFPVGTMIYFQCFPGYKLEGTEFLECMYDLIWSDSPPRCLDVEVCPLPPVVTHGDYICHPRPCEHYNHGTVVEFYCDPGYTLTNDYKYITCQYGEWFPSYQVYCVKTDFSAITKLIKNYGWYTPLSKTRSTLLTPVDVSASNTKSAQENCSSGPDFVVVDGVPVMLPSYDEAVSSGLNALAPGCVSPAGQGYILQDDDQNPPAYPGPDDLDRLPAEFDTCDSISGSSELLQSLYTSSVCQMGAHPVSERTDAINSTTGEVASTSPSIDIADEIPLMDEDP